MADINRLIEVMARLRDPQGGCPWDLAQDFSSIAPYTIEEAYEVADAIERGDMDDLCDELGDLLLNVVFHARLAEEAQHFDFEDVVLAICDKMIRRHPHVFQAHDPSNDPDLHRAWEREKERERAGKGDNASALSGVAKALPALMRAQKIGKRAARVGFDWKTPAAVNAKIREELLECEEVLEGPPARIHEEVGDLLFAVSNLARHTGVDAEQALRDATTKFERRFEHVERQAHDAGVVLADCSAEELDGYWRQAKGE